jgi:hypothetical protein
VRRFAVVVVLDHFAQQITQSNRNEKPREETNAGGRRNHDEEDEELPDQALLLVGGGPACGQVLARDGGELPGRDLAHHFDLIPVGDHRRRSGGEKDPLGAQRENGDLLGRGGPIAPAAHLHGAFEVGDLSFEDVKGRFHVTRDQRAGPRWVRRR